MKNKYLAIFVVLCVAFMFLAGCGAKDEAPDEDKKPSTKPTTKPVEVDDSEPEPEPEPEPARKPSKQIQELLQKHVGRVTSLTYMYQDQTIKPEEWETRVKGNKMQVKLREMDNIREDVYIDNIYLNIASKTAEGFCERTVYRCVDPNSPIEVNFKKYYRKTPFEWINEVTYAEKDSEEQMQQRNVWKIKYTEGSKTTTMWVDEYYGIPLKIRVADAGAVNEYIFEDIAFNDVDDADLEHQFIRVTY
jgi:hypothetical protein